MRQRVKPQKCLNVKLELALVAIQNCLNLLHNDLGPDTKYLWLINQISYSMLKFVITCLCTSLCQIPLFLLLYPGIDFDWILKHCINQGGGGMWSFLGCQCTSLNKRVPGFSSDVKIFIGMNNVQNCEETVEGRRYRQSQIYMSPK